MVLIKIDKLEEKFNNFLKKILIIGLIITCIFSYIPIMSFAEEDLKQEEQEKKEEEKKQEEEEEEEEEEELYPALVPAFADAIISKYVTTSVIANGGGSSANGDFITDYTDTGDGWDSISKVTYPNGVQRIFRNYAQWKGSYAGNHYWDGNIGSDGCAPSAAAIILSGYGIDANPGKVVDAFHELGYDYSSMGIIQQVLKEKYNIDSEWEEVSDSSIQHIRDNFNAGRPIIAGVYNHFVAYLGEDSNGNLILSDPGYTDGRNENTLSGYVQSHYGYDILLIKNDGNNAGQTKTKNNKSKNKKSKTSTSAEGQPQACNVSNGGYDAIFTSGTTGRQFREFKQDASNYNYPYLGGGTYWGEQCGLVATGIVGSGYKEITMQDIANSLQSTGWQAYLTKHVKDFTGQDVSFRTKPSQSEFAEKIASGCVAVIHDPEYSYRGHYLAVLDISKDKKRVYVSNPDVYGSHMGGCKIKQGWNYLNDIYGELGNICFVSNDGSAVDYTGEGIITQKALTEDKIFYIGDSWMVLLNVSGKAKSPSSYFYAESGRNADWVLNTYSSMNIPGDSSCIVVGFGLNGLDTASAKRTQELVDKLSTDYSDKEIFVLQTPHICDGYIVDPNFNIKVDNYNKIIRDYCENKDGVTFINPTTNIVSDMGRGYLKNEYAMNPRDTAMGGGKIHLNNSGNEIWYEDIISCIKENITFGSYGQQIDMSKNIVERIEGDPSSGYKINIDIYAEVENLLNQLEDRGYHLENYLSTKNQFEYLKNMIKATIVTQYPDLRTADEIANDIPINDDEVQGCIKIKRYTDGETEVFASGSLTNPKDDKDENEGMFLAYMPYDKFMEMISNTDKDVFNYFTMDSSNNIVVAGWETMEVTVDGPTQTNADDPEVGSAPSGYTVDYTPQQVPYTKLTTKNIDYLNQVSNYMMPFNLMWSLLVYGHDDDFINDVANLVIDTEIVIGCFDATNVRVTTNTRSYSVSPNAELTAHFNENENRSTGNIGSDEITYHFVVIETDTLKTDNPELNVIYADSWTAVYNKDYKIKSETKEEEDSVELDDKVLDVDIFIKKGDRYLADKEPDNEKLKEKIDKTIENETDKILEKRILELKDDVDKENAKIEYKYEALRKKLNEYVDADSSLGEFFAINDVQSNVINMISSKYSRKQIENEFSSENDLMVKYAKKIQKSGYKSLLNKAIDLIDKQLIPNEELYNEITKNGENIIPARVYTTVLENVSILIRKKLTDQKENIHEEITTTKVEEMVGNVRWKTDKQATENSFVKVLSKNTEAKTNLYGISSWFFESMENTASIADMIDLMKMIFQYVYENSDFGITIEDEEELLKMFDPEQMAAFNRGSTAGAIVGGASYSSLTFTDEELRILYKLSVAENASNLKWTACVVVNRILSSAFPNTMRDVVFAPGQFEVTWNGMYDAASPTQSQIDEINEVLKSGDITGGAIGFQTIELYDSSYPTQTWETPIELLRERYDYGGSSVFFTTASIQAELSQYK